jgi:hypothetical protein
MVKSGLIVSCGHLMSLREHYLRFRLHARTWGGPADVRWVQKALDLGLDITSLPVGNRLRGNLASLLGYGLVHCPTLVGPLVEVLLGPSGEDLRSGEVELFDDANDWRVVVENAVSQNQPEVLSRVFGVMTHMSTGFQVSAPHADELLRQICLHADEKTFPGFVSVILDPAHHAWLMASADERATMEALIHTLPAFARRLPEVCEEAVQEALEGAIRALAVALGDTGCLEQKSFVGLFPGSVPQSPKPSPESLPLLARRAGFALVETLESRFPQGRLALSHPAISPVRGGSREGRLLLSSLEQQSLAARQGNALVTLSLAMAFEYSSFYSACTFAQVLQAGTPEATVTPVRKVRL